MPAMPYFAMFSLIQVSPVEVASAPRVVPFRSARPFSLVSFAAASAMSLS